MFIKSEEHKETQETTFLGGYYRTKVDIEAVEIQKNHKRAPGRFTAGSIVRLVVGCYNAAPTMSHVTDDRGHYANTDMKLLEDILEKPDEIKKIEKEELEPLMKKMNRLTLIMFVISATMIITGLFIGFLGITYEGPAPVVAIGSAMSILGLIITVAHFFFDVGQGKQKKEKKKIIGKIFALEGKM